MDVVILAGGTCDPDLAALSGVATRAELPFRGRRFVDIVLEATAPLGDLVLVGGPAGLADRQVAPGSTFLESVSSGLDAVRTEAFLLVTCDTPFLTTEGLRDFLDRCDPEAGVNYPIIPIADCEAQFPGLKRTALKMREGRFTGGNAALIRTGLMRASLPVLEQAYAARKSPLRLAGLVGWQTLLRVMVGRLSPNTLTQRTLERAVGAFLGMPVKGIVTHHAEIGTDIDDATQYSALLALQNRDETTST